MCVFGQLARASTTTAAELPPWHKDSTLLLYLSTNQSLSNHLLARVPHRLPQCCCAQWQESLPRFKKKVEWWLQHFDKQIGDQDWFAGTLTVADFVIWARLYVINALIEGCVDAVPALAAFMKRFGELSGVKEYLASDTHLQAPFNNKIASWGA